MAKLRKQNSCLAWKENQSDQKGRNIHGQAPVDVLGGQKLGTRRARRGRVQLRRFFRS